MTVFSSYFAVGAGAGGGEVDVDSFTGPGTLAKRSAFLPFDAFTEGVSLAVLAGGQLAVGTASGSSHVKLFDRTTPAPGLTASFLRSPASRAASIFPGSMRATLRSAPAQAGDRMSRPSTPPASARPLPSSPSIRPSPAASTWLGSTQPTLPSEPHHSRRSSRSSIFRASRQSSRRFRLACRLYRRLDLAGSADGHLGGRSRVGQHSRQGPRPTGNDLASFFAFDPATYSGGVDVAGWT